MPRPFRVPNCSFSHLEISWSSKSHHHVLASFTCVPRIVLSAFIFNLYLSGAIQALIVHLVSIALVGARAGCENSTGW